MDKKEYTITNFINDLSQYWITLHGTEKRNISTKLVGVKNCAKLSKILDELASLSNKK